MASFTLTIAGALGGSIGDLTTAFQITDDDSDRLLEWVVASFGSHPDGTPRTPHEAIAAYAEWLLKHTLTQEADWRRMQAAIAAREAVASIPYSPA